MSPQTQDAEQVLVVNAGSSSLKLQLVPSRQALTIERIGTGGPARNHTEAFSTGLARLDAGRIAAVGHRLVHGGMEFTEPCLITPQVIEAVQRLSRLAPLHNPPGLEGIHAARRALPDVPHVAVFDTAFHSGLPRRAHLTGLPWEQYEEGIRTYGFHGTNHDWVTREAARMLGRSREDLRIVSLHLGNGASAAAVAGGKSIDTSMGFTPLAGLLMGTRSGDLDPGIILHLLEGGMSRHELDDMLNRRSGLLGLSGVSNDLRDIHAAIAAGNRQAAAALEVYTYRIRKVIGAYAAAMEGLDAIVFTGGVGENDATVREEALKGLGWMGVTYDQEANRSGARVISGPGSAASCLVIAADEEGLIATQTREVIGSGVNA